MKKTNEQKKAKKEYKDFKKLANKNLLGAIEQMILAPYKALGKFKNEI